MLEVILLPALWSALGNTLRLRGYNPRPCQVMLVALWFAGELTGFTLGVFFSLLLKGEITGEMLILAVMLAFITAAICGICAFVIATEMPDRRKHGSQPREPVWRNPEVAKPFGQTDRAGEQITPSDSTGQIHRGTGDAAAEYRLNTVGAHTTRTRC
jgi:hypothetical protein